MLLTHAQRNLVETAKRCGVSMRQAVSALSRVAEEGVRLTMFSQEEQAGATTTPPTSSVSATDTTTSTTTGTTRA